MKLTNRFSLLIAITPLLVLATAGCVSLSSHQSGRTVGKSNASIPINVNAGFLEYEHFDSYDNDIRFVLLGCGAYYGVTENLDIGFKGNISTHTTVTSKYQFIGNKTSLFASSAGLDIGTSLLAFPAAGSLDFSSSLSLYNSIHPTDNLAFTFTPSYTYLGYTQFMRETNRSYNNNLYGYSAGVIFGQKHQVSLEISQYVNNQHFTFKNRPIFGIAYIFNPGW